MSKYTPGPWGAETRPGHAPTDRWVITAKTVERVAVVSVRGGADHPEANAHLIAAAPDLLEALEKLVGATGHIQQVPLHILRKAGDAIGKARGESQ